MAQASGYASLAGSAVQFAGSLISANSQEKSAVLNSRWLELEANAMEIQKEMENKRIDRAERRLISSSVAAVAGSGIEFTGSPIEVMLDSVAQMETDRAIMNYNMAMGQQAKMSQAAMTKIEGKMQAGNTRAKGFSNLMQGLSSYASQYGGTKGKNVQATSGAGRAMYKSGGASLYSKGGMSMSGGF